MKNFLKVIAFCSLLNVKLILSAAKETLTIEIKYTSSSGGRSQNNITNEINNLSCIINESFTINIHRDDNLVKDTWIDSLQLLNKILNTNLIKQKQAVNHNWNQENLKFALRNCPNIQAIKRSLLLIDYFKKNNQNDLFQKTIESCSYFLDTLSKDLVPKDNVKTDYSNINKSAQKLYANITQETNQPGMPFYFRYPFFGYYYIKFIELFTSLKNYTMSKVFRISSTDKNDDILIIDKLEENSNDETKYEIRDSESFDSWSSTRSDDEDLLANVYP